MTVTRLPANELRMFIECWLSLVIHKTLNEATFTSWTVQGFQHRTVPWLVSSDHAEQNTLAIILLRVV